MTTSNPSKCSKNPDKNCVNTLGCHVNGCLLPGEPISKPSQEDDEERKRAEHAHRTKQLKEEMPAMIESTSLWAQLTFARYQAYVKAGFTESQALHIVCNLK